jgi:hypothetical protein
MSRVAEAIAVALSLCVIPALLGASLFFLTKF